MEILVAQSAGYCMGVRRAIEVALKVATEEARTIYTYGPLIHNPQALEELRRKGVIPVSEGDEIPPAPVIIRAHGVSPDVRARIEKCAERLVDATCPKVATIQQTIVDFSVRGYAIVIAGDADHPEVVGLVGHARGPAFVVSTPREVEELPPLERLLLVAQTTQDLEIFDAIRERILERFPAAQAQSTICQSTHRRQTEVREMARKVDALIVLGGRDSANTRRLAEIAKALGTRAYHVETASELPLDEVRRFTRLGITAGASTPVWIIEEAVRFLSNLRPADGSDRPDAASGDPSDPA